MQDKVNFGIEEMKKKIQQLFVDEAVTLEERQQTAKIYVDSSYCKGKAVGFKEGMEEMEDAQNGLYEQLI